MKLEYKINETATVVVEGNTTDELFTEVAKCAEIFSQTQCQACKSYNVVPQVRHVGNYTYREMKCKDCFASLGFGLSQTEKGALFPQRKNLKTQEKYENYGWRKWSPDDEEQAPPPKPAATSGKPTKTTKPKTAPPATPAAPATDDEVPF